MADHFKRLAEVEREGGRLADSLGAAQRGHELTVAIYGADHPRALFSGSLLAVATGMVGRWAEARQLQRDLLPQARKALGNEHWRAGVMQPAVARTQRHFGERREALASVEQALAVLVPAPGEEHDQVKQARTLMAALNGPAAP